MNKAVILARGLGKRMRAADRSAPLAADQVRAADAGVKAMIPIGRPFLDFVLSALADASLRDVCLVIGPEHTAIRDYYASLPSRRIRVSFAIQEHPVGTANALLSAKPFLSADPFLVLNSDNFYPVEVFRAMCELGEPGLPVFERESLIRESNIPRDRVLNYALLEIGADGYLKKIIEKPASIPEAPVGREVFISMNCWRFDSSIFHACELVPRSARGEFELPEAVQFGLANLGLCFKTVPFRAGILDLSQRSDIATVAQRLSSATVVL